MAGPVTLDSKTIGIAALIGGAINGSLSFLTGDGVYSTRRGPNNGSWALQPTIPVPQFDASYSKPSLGTVAYSATIGAALGVGLTWFFLTVDAAPPLEHYW